MLSSSHCSDVVVCGGIDVLIHKKLLEGDNGVLFVENECGFFVSRFVYRTVRYGSIAVCKQNAICEQTSCPLLPSAKGCM